MVRPYRTHTPQVHPAARVAENATLIGDVHLDKNVNVWYGAVLRGDNSSISIGEDSNLQDGVICHVASDAPVWVGHQVTVGHGAILHGCTVKDRSLIGMGAILLNGCTVGENCLIAAGSLVPQNTEIPDGCLAVGSPARVVRQLRPEELTHHVESANHYMELAAGALPLWAEGAE